MRISDWSSDVCSSDLIIEEIGRYVGPGEIERIDRAFLAAKAQFALEQRIAARDIAEKGILGHRDQLERVASAQAQRVDRGAPGEAMEAILQQLGERESLLAPQPDQPLAYLDTVGGGIVLVSAHPPLSARILSAYAAGPHLKVAVPATRTLAPAAIARGAVSRSIPPSTSRSIALPVLSIIR